MSYMLGERESTQREVIMYCFLANKPIVRLIKLGDTWHVIGMTKYGETYHRKFDSERDAKAFYKGMQS